ncbi:MAG TPA: proton-conducting transporter membrane subunit [Capsulimonadaceae bacterium]|jgi:hydrogenase-4 component F
MTPILWLLPIPLVVACVAFAVRRSSFIAAFTACAMWLQAAIAIALWYPHLNRDAAVIVASGFRVDSTSALFVILTTLVAASALTQAVSFFAKEAASEHPPTPWQVAQVYIFTPLFLLAMYAVVTADNLGYLWIGMEATTLLSAPMVYYHRTSTALEATWKYLIVCSVGIAMGFFGTALIYSASQQVQLIPGGSLSLTALVAHANLLPVGLLRLGYVFIVLGYGTKAGLFPLHSWLPDAHSEAPAPVSAMLSGGLLNCALVALWRVGGIMTAAGQERLVMHTLLPMGAITVAAAALFLVKQHDVKRMLAYSSMENVGLMAIAIAIGSSTGFALQAVNHSVAKVGLFLIAGALVQTYGSSKIRKIRGVMVSQPAQGIAFFCLIAAVAGTPPFGSFLSEWQILTAAFNLHHYATVGVVALALAIAFIALSIHAIDMLMSDRDKTVSGPPPARLSFVVGALIVAALVLGLALSPAVVAMAGGLTR